MMISHLFFLPSMMFSKIQAHKHFMGYFLRAFGDFKSCHFFKLLICWLQNSKIKLCKRVVLTNRFRVTEKVQHFIMVNKIHKY